MAKPQIAYQLGSPIVNQPWYGVYNILSDGALESASTTRIVFSDTYGDKIVFSGSFTLDAGGIVTGGTVNGFGVASQSIKAISGSGYAFSATDLIDAFDNADNDEGAAFWGLIWERPIDQTGSAQDDEIWGTGFAGAIRGEAGNDHLWGSTGNEVVKGGDGNDLVSGGFGHDTLFGGKGGDVFAFFDKLDFDRIEDFAPKSDFIGLAYDPFDELGLGFVGKAEFRIGGGAKTADQHLIYNDSTGALYYDEDGSGVAAKVQIAELDRHLDLHSRNFFVTNDYDIK